MVAFLCKLPGEPPVNQRFLRTQVSVFVKALILLGIMIHPIEVKGEQKQEFGPYEIHYIALPATVLQPEIAKKFDVVRSKTSGFVNISVFKTLEDGSRQTLSPFIRGSVSNSFQQKRPLEFSRHYEGDAVYQLANFWYSQGETMTFNLEILADPNDRPITMKFSQALFPD